MDLLAAIIILTLFVLGFAAYILMMIYYPEWVGITGRNNDDRASSDQNEQDVNSRNS